jgi:hypothetical protein
LKIRTKEEKEKSAAATRAYYQKNKEKVKAYRKEWGIKNKEKSDAIRSRWKENNLTKHKEQQLNWAARNREEINKKTAEYKKLRPWLVAASATARRASIMQRMPSWADQEKINKIYKEAAEMRANGIDVHVDHIIPLKGKYASGLHVHNNLRIIPASENIKKSNNFTPERFSCSTPSVVS